MKEPIFGSLAEALLSGFNPDLDVNANGDYEEEKRKPLKGEALAINKSEVESGVTAKVKHGRSRSVRIDRQFNSHENAMDYMRQHQTSFLQNVSDNLDFAKKHLAAKKLPLEVPQDKVEQFSNLFTLLTDDKEQGGLGLEHDSFEALAALIILHIGKMLDQELDQVVRLKHAVAFGNVTTLWDHYYTMGKAQKVNAKKPRDQLLSGIYLRLAKRKLASNLTPKELWQDFVSILEGSKQEFEKVIETQANKGNPDTWEVGFCRILGEKVSPPESITYKQFRNALNRKNAR